MKNRLTELIKSKNINVTEMYKVTGVDRSNFYRYEKGEVIPNLSTALKIAGYLNEHVESIWEIE